MFQIGDQIIYPIHGVGYIIAIQEKEILGEIKVYYIVNIPKKNMKIMIPKEKAESFGVRRLTESSVLEDILENFIQGSTDPLLYTNQRYCTDLNTKKIKSGDIIKSTEIIRDLTRKSKISKLGKEDAKLLEDARHMFISELMQVRSLSEEKATNLLDSVLAVNDIESESLEVQSN